MTSTNTFKFKWKLIAFLVIVFAIFYIFNNNKCHAQDYYADTQNMVSTTALSYFERIAQKNLLEDYIVWRTDYNHCYMAIGDLSHDGSHYYGEATIYEYTIGYNNNLFTHWEDSNLNVYANNTVIYSSLLNDDMPSMFSMSDYLFVLIVILSTLYIVAHLFRNIIWRGYKHGK